MRSYFYKHNLQLYAQRFKCICVNEHRSKSRARMQKCVLEIYLKVLYVKILSYELKKEHLKND